MLLPLTLSALLAPSAEASSDLVFRTNKPVIVYVDGRQASLAGPLKHKVEDLEPGLHEVRIQGLFGKTVFEAEVDLPDNTVTLADWSGSELAVVKTEWRDEADPSLYAEEPAEEPTEPVEEASEAAGEEELIAEAPDEGDVPVEGALADEEVPAGDAVAEASDPDAFPVDAAPELQPLALPETGHATSLPTPTSSKPTMSIQAREGMRIEVVHEGQRVMLTVEDGVLSIEDPSGVEIAFGGVEER